MDTSPDSSVVGINKGHVGGFNQSKKTCQNGNLPQIGVKIKLHLDAQVGGISIL